MDADTGQIGAVALTNANANAVHLNENPVHLSLAVDKSASVSMPRKVPWADLERYVNRIGAKPLYCCNDIFNGIDAFDPHVVKTHADAMFAKTGQKIPDHDPA